MVFRYYKFALFTSCLLMIACLCALCSKVGKEAFMTPQLVAPDNLVGVDIQVYSDDALFSTSNSVFCLTLSRKANLITAGDLQEEGYKEYRASRLSNLSKALKNDVNLLKEYNAPAFYDAEIYGTFSITANCPLFGIPAGENLVHHCRVIYIDKESHFICSYPNFDILNRYSGVDFPLGDYFPQGAALPSFKELVFGFDSVPPEKPEHYTLTVTIPISYESWTRFEWMQKNDTPKGSYVYYNSTRSLSAAIQVFK